MLLQAAGACLAGYVCCQGQDPLLVDSEGGDSVRLTRQSSQPNFAQISQYYYLFLIENAC